MITIAMEPIRTGHSSRPSLVQSMLSDKGSGRYRLATVSSSLNPEYSRLISFPALEVGVIKDLVRNTRVCPLYAVASKMQVFEQKRPSLIKGVTRHADCEQVFFLLCLGDSAGLRDIAVSIAHLVLATKNYYLKLKRNSNDFLNRLDDSQIVPFYENRKTKGVIRSQSGSFGS